MFLVHLSLHFKTSLSEVFAVNIIIKVGLITITKIWHVDTLSERDRGELGNGLFDR